ncbi:ribosomal protein L21-like protein [Boletus edulis]|nr:ribosomal protein L21-like protein [Boletus edulis]
MATWQIRSWLSQTLRKVATSSLHSAPDSAAAALSLIQKYILTPRDILTVPRLKDVCVGDVLHLRDLHEIGTREYTLRGDPLPRNHIKVEATVIEQTKGKMEVVFKKKRRKGYQKTIKNKHPYTRLRIGPIQFTNLPLSS